MTAQRLQRATSSRTELDRKTSRGRRTALTSLQTRGTRTEVAGEAHAALRQAAATVAAWLVEAAAAAGRGRGRAGRLGHLLDAAVKVARVGEAERVFRLVLCTPWLLCHVR